MAEMGRIVTRIPQTCRECRFFIQEFGYICIALENQHLETSKWLENNYAGGRPIWCPIIGYDREP